MYRKIFLTILTLVTSSFSFACSCAYSEDFNLFDYDSYEYIFEVSVKSKYEFKNDSEGKDLPYDPRLIENGFFNCYYISILEVFKGEMNLSEKMMCFPGGSSCSWEPEIGFTYIFYANSLNSIEACNRKLIKEYSPEYYGNEKSILQSLETKPKKIKIKSDNKLVLEGNYIEEKRDGIWKIYSTKGRNTIALTLTYAKGMLLSVKKEKGFSETDEWLNMTYLYYLEQVQPCNENTTKPKEE
ncbi:MAG: hypothetical protein ACK4WD_00790 [Flavobacteriales bacterium]|jgi:hypothetical protein